MTARIQSPRRSCLKKQDSVEGSSKSKRVIFDEIFIKEYPLVLGDNPAVSSGAPVTLGWQPTNESVIDIDFYEYCRIPERRPRKKMILSVRRRANFLLGSGYSLEEIADATLEVEKVKRERADSLRSAGFSNPWEMLSGAVETTGVALKRVDVLGVGIAAGVVLGAGAAAGNAAVQGMNTMVGAGVQGMNTMVNVGADVTVKTGQILANSVHQSTRAMTQVASAAGKNLVVKPVGAVVTTTGKAVTTGGKVIGNTGRAVGTVVTSTGKVLASIITPGASFSNSPTPPAGTPKSEGTLRRRTSLTMNPSVEISI